MSSWLPLSQVWQNPPSFSTKSQCGLFHLGFACGISLSPSCYRNCSKKVVCMEVRMATHFIVSIGWQKNQKLLMTVEIFSKHKKSMAWMSHLFKHHCLLVHEQNTLGSQNPYFVWIEWFSLDMLLRLSLQFNVLNDMAVAHDRLLCFCCGTIAQV